MLVDRRPFHLERPAASSSGGSRVRAVRWRRAPAFVLLLGAASLIMLVLTDWLGQRERSYFAFTYILMDIRTTVATSHLWLEEGITGDDASEMERAWADVREAMQMTEILRRGGEADGFIVAPPTDPTLLALVDQVGRLLVEWKQHFEERAANPEIAGEGSELERLTDALFATFMAVTGDLEERVEARLAAYHTSSRLLVLAILVVWCGIVGVSVTGLSQHERRRRQAEEALQQANERLETRVAERTRDLSELNEKLNLELGARRQAEAALRESEAQLRHLSARLIAVQETERRRIAAELHDALGHSLVLAKLGVGGVRRALRLAPADAPEHCDELARAIDLAIEEVRRLARDLRPPVLDDLGLSGALRWLVDNHARNGRADFGIAVPDMDELFSHDAQLILYRVVQEAFTNVEKHAADATSVSLSVERRGDAVCFIVTDDGRGFDPGRVLATADGERGCGLATMDERARMLGGSLAVESAEGKGTRVALSVPVQSGGIR